jgi:diadenosine tetraphosphate (Ap4A) HIT family hydrolase
MRTTAIEPGRADQAVRPERQRNEGACQLATCRFCGLKNGANDLFMELHGEAPHLAIPGIPGSMMVMLCAFPLGHRGGHLLITPKEHHPSLAQCPGQEALRQTAQTVAETLREMFPNHWLFAFEHGAGSIQDRPVKCGGCHVDHAHGHVLVLDRSIRFDEIRELTEATLDGLGWDVPSQAHATARPWNELAAVCGEYPYLQIGSLWPVRRSVIYQQISENQSIPSQLLRRLVATAAGRPNPSYWNWKIALQHNLRPRLEQYRDAALGFKRAVEEFIRARMAG